MPYVDRTLLNQDIVNHLKDRKAMRASHFESMKDKSFNPLICLCASPGSGKSTFLQHFPYSKEYEAYLKNLPFNSPPIIILTTFNSRFETNREYNMMGLRILYGCLSSLFGIGNVDKVISWKHFTRTYHVIDPDDAIDIIISVFGNRPIFLGIDELSKAIGTSSQINLLVSSFGTLLNQYTNVDLIVTSLSSSFIAHLTTGNQRKVIYTVLPPLFEDELGKNETRHFVNNFLNNSYSEDSLKDISNDFCARMVSSCYLLTSGHPRFTENFVHMCNKNPQWIDNCKVYFETRFNHAIPSSTSMKMLTTMSKSFLNGLNNEDIPLFPISQPLIPELIPMIFRRSFTDITSKKHALERSYIESGYIFVADKKLSRVTIGIPLANLLQIFYVAQDLDNIPAGSVQYNQLIYAIKSLFKDFFLDDDKEISFALFSERIIALNIYSGWIDNSFTDIFANGWKLNRRSLPKDLSFQFIQDSTDIGTCEPSFLTNLKDCSITMFPKAQSFFEFIVKINQKYYFIQIKSNFPERKGIQYREKNIENIVQYAKSYGLEEANVFIVFYENFNAEKKINLVNGATTHFIKNNVHIINRTELMSWLLPSFRIIPKLIDEMKI